MPFDFRDHPGQLFVVATLLPLAAFLLILLASAIWAALRPYQKNSAVRPLFDLFGGEDEDRPGRGRWAAYTATYAIAIAFLFSLSGAIQYFTSLGTDEAAERLARHTLAESRTKLGTDEKPGAVAKLRDAEDKLAALKRGDPKPAAAELRKAEAEADEARDAVEKLEGDAKKAEKDLTTLEAKWDGHFDWLRILHIGNVPVPGTAVDGASATALRLGFHIDALSVVMFLMVTFVATLIHIFSIGYMSEELQPTVEDHQVHVAHGHFQRRGRFGRFFLYLALFCFSMLNLILADNLFQVFLSWELVGICSYLLIGFYYERKTASNAANKAFITNRVGDAGFIVGLLILFTYLGTFNIQEMFTRIRSPLQDKFYKQLQLGGQIVRGNPAPNQTLTLDPKGSEVVLFPRVILSDFHGVGPEYVSDVPVQSTPGPTDNGTMPYWIFVVAGLGIFLGCVGKSAQFPLQVWLPDAMEGPTPVSALIHAATMVAAGVYLVGRVFPLFAPDALLVIAYVGAITLFVAATIAVVMTDIKKVLAYSTVSQLGFMMLALGVGGWSAGLFHLVTHAFFKALLFLGSGAVIYGCHHEQDMMKMGGLYRKMPITAITMLMGVLAISGVPFFTGWYSKDAILSASFGFVYLNKQHALLFILPLVTACLTTFYMFRMWFMTFTGEPRDHHVYDHAAEAPPLMTVPLVILAVLSVGAAWPAPVGKHAAPLWDAEASWLEHQIHHAQPQAVVADFGVAPEYGEVWAGPLRDKESTVRYWAIHHAHLVGAIVLAVALIGLVFALLIYYYRKLDPADAKEEFPRIHAFLLHKWYFDEIYSVVVVRPALVVAHLFRWFDLTVIDGIIHGVARLGVWVSKWDGIFDRNIVDGLVNVVGNTTYAVGAGFRRIQTGFLRSYVLFLVLAAVGIFVWLAAM
jgi:NADH-quinone oxidoreductase subunit L